MPDPFTLALLIKMAIVGHQLFALAYLIMLAFNDITAWFADYRASRYRDVDDIGFTLNERLRDGRYRTVQGVFNTREELIRTGRQVISNAIDRTLADYHAYDDLVLYS